MGRSTGFEAYPRYDRFLQQGTVWPSESNEETVLIAEMVPRYAASAHAKLLRWSHTIGAQSRLNIYDQREREKFVLNSMLSQALVQKAHGLPLLAEVETPAHEVTPREIILAFAPVVAQHTELDITAIFKLCEALATVADEEWTITVQSR